MAINPQPQGGLNQVKPAPAARPQGQPPQGQPPQGQAPQGGNLAARAAAMEQDQTTAPEDYFTKTLEDLRKQRESLNSQITSLKSSLDHRKGLPFDPVLMAAASGFLRPTKTGSFGESLGYATDQMSNEAEKEFARKQANAKLGLELDEKALAFKTRGLEMEDMMRMSGMGGQSPRPPAGGPVGGPVGGPAGGAAGAPAGGPAAPVPGGGGTIGQSGVPNQMKMISDSDITRAYAISKEYGDKISNIAKIQREDIISTPEGPFSRSRQAYIEAEPFQSKIVERDFGRYIGPKKVPERLSREYDEIKKKAIELDDPEIEFNWFKKQGWLEGKQKPTKADKDAGAPADETGKDGAPLTVEERERRNQLRVEREKKQIDEEQTSISDMRTNARKSREVSNIAKDMTAFATSNPRAFQLLQNATLRDAIFRAAEKGITTPGGSIAFPARELETYKLNNEDREALMMFMQAYARQTVEFRKAARAPGEGATTEAEGLLFAQLGALPSDTARVILLKSEALEVKAEYDRQLFREWNKFTKANKDANYQDFLVSDEKDALDNAYDGRLKSMRERNADLFRNVPKAAPASGSKPPAAKPQQASGSKPQAGAKQPPTIKGNDDPVFINLQPGDLYIAPDGTVRTKR